MIGSLAKGYLVYSFLGWSAESLKNWNDTSFISCNPVFKYLFSKDICWLPFPPAYGLGGVFIAYLWKHYPNLSLISVAIISAIMFNVIELIGGYLGEKFLCSNISTCQEGNKLWNYTATANIGGYIDVEHTFYWVLLGLVGYYSYPWLMSIDNSKLFITLMIIWLVISIHKLHSTDKTGSFSHLL